MLERKAHKAIRHSAIHGTSLLLDLLLNVKKYEGVYDSDDKMCTQSYIVAEYYTILLMKVATIRYGHVTTTLLSNTYNLDDSRNDELHRCGYSITKRRTYNHDGRSNDVTRM